MAQTKVQLLQPDLGDVIDFDSSTLFMDGADNRVGIRNTNPQYELDVTGTINATNFRGNISVGTIDDWITHAGDTNTKFGFPTDDTYQIFTGGSARLRIHPTGQITIGAIAATTDKSGILHTRSSNTTSPVVFENDTENADVVIRTTGSNKHSIIGFGDSADNFIGNIDYDHQNNSMVFDTNGGERLSISSSGLVTQVETGTGNGQGGIKASTASAGGNAGFGFITGGTQRFSIVTIGSAGSEALRVYDLNNSVERLRIVSDGNITTQGLSNPSFDNDGGNTKIVEITGDGTVGEYGQINLSGNQDAHGNTVGVIKFINRENAHSSSGSGATSRSLGAIEMRASTNDSNADHDSGGYFRFVVKGDGSGNAERLRIKGNGSIYTVTQGAKFGISQDPELTTMGSTSGTWQVPEVDGSVIGAEMRIGDHNTNSTALIRLASYGSGDGGVGGGAIMFTNTRCGSASHHSDLAAIKGARESLGKGYLRFFTASQAANTEKMRITSGGDVGIGTTNPQSNFAAGTTTTKFAVVTQKNVEGAFHETAHFSAGGDDGETGAIVRIGQYENDRGLYIKGGQASSDRATARFGLRNSGATDTDVLTLYQNSTDYRVGIGTTAPGEKLDVIGSVQATTGFKTAGHPVLTYASFTDISGGSYATRVGSTGTSTLRHTQIYAGGSHIATFDGVNYRLGIMETTPDAPLHITGGLPHIRLENSGTNASAGDTFGQIDFKHNDSNDPGVTASIKCIAEDNAGNSYLTINNANGGNDTERLRITSGGAVLSKASHFDNYQHLKIQGGHGGGNSVNYILVCKTNTAGARLSGHFVITRNDGASGIAISKIEANLISNASAGDFRYQTRAMSTKGAYPGVYGQWVTLTYGGNNYYAIRLDPFDDSSRWPSKPDHGYFTGTENNCVGNGFGTVIDNVNNTITNVTELNDRQGATILKNSDSYVHGKIKYGNYLQHGVQGGGFSLYPNNGSNNKTTIRVAGLVSGCFIFQMGYYNSSGQGEGGFACSVSGYQTHTGQYTIDNIKDPYADANSSISSINKQNSYFEFTITNSHGSYTGGGTWGIIGNDEMTVTVTYHS